MEACGLAGKNPSTLEAGFGAGESALLVASTRVNAAVLDAMTFAEIAPLARGMIATRTRFLCPACAAIPAVGRKEGALPWTFWCSVHRVRLRAADGRGLEALLPGVALDRLDPLARRGAARLAAWAEGRESERPTIPDLLALLTCRHRRPSPPALHEQPRLSLGARRDNHTFLCRPIVRQALLVVVPEYDRAAPVLAKPVRPGLHALACGSLLQNYALAIGIARLSEDPAAQAAAVLAAADEEGEARVLRVLRSWPSAMRRGIDLRLERLRAKSAVRMGSSAPRRGWIAA